MDLYSILELNIISHFFLANSCLFCTPHYPSTTTVKLNVWFHIELNCNMMHFQHNPTCSTHQGSRKTYGPQQPQSCRMWPMHLFIIRSYKAAIHLVVLGSKVNKEKNPTPLMSTLFLQLLIPISMCDLGY